eukprot:4837614-Lingulodinium_polyedra.AAC.1
MASAMAAASVAMATTCAGSGSHGRSCGPEHTRLVAGNGMPNGAARWASTPIITRNPPCSRGSARHSM